MAILHWIVEKKQYPSFTCHLQQAQPLRFGYLQRLSSFLLHFQRVGLHLWCLLWFHERTLFHFLLKWVHFRGITSPNLLIHLQSRNYIRLPPLCHLKHLSFLHRFRHHLMDQSLLQEDHYYLRLNLSRVTQWFSALAICEMNWNLFFQIKMRLKKGYQH